MSSGSNKDGMLNVESGEWGPLSEESTAYKVLQSSLSLNYNKSTKSKRHFKIWMGTASQVQLNLQTTVLTTLRRERGGGHMVNNFVLPFHQTFTLVLMSFGYFEAWSVFHF